MDHVVVWADIPVLDMQRAMKFYAELTQEPVSAMPGTNDTVAVVGAPGVPESPRVSVDLYTGGTPSHDGATVYFGSRGDIDGMLARAEGAGGRILQEKQDMGEPVGWIAFAEDTEGNRIGIQQPPDSMMR
jgi:predicted enzyme related to lactoylglutathione lyase